MIAIITIVVLWLIWPDITGQTTAPAPIALQAGFLDPCNSILQCAPSLTCQGGICKRNIGGNCRTLSDCVDQATVCENGICQITETGGLNQPPDSNGDCDNGLSVNSANICKGDQGFTCVANGDCLSGICQGNACTALQEQGQSCSSNDNCADGLTCSLGFCQSPNVPTGTEGAYCDPAPCNSGLNCINGFCTLTCQSLGQACNNSDLLCIDPYTCNSSGPTGFASTCGLAANNMCNINNKCATGFKCKNGKCLGMAGQPAFEKKQCLSGKLSDYKLLTVKDDKYVINTNYPSLHELQGKPLDICEVDGTSYILKNNKEIYMATKGAKKYTLCYLADNHNNQQLLHIFAHANKLYASTILNGYAHISVFDKTFEDLLVAKHIQLQNMIEIKDISAANLIVDCMQKSARSQQSNEQQFYVLGKQDPDNIDYHIYIISIANDKLQSMTIHESNVSTHKLEVSTQTKHKILHKHNNITYFNIEHALDLHMAGYVKEINGYYDDDGNLNLVSQTCL